MRALADCRTVGLDALPQAAAELRAAGWRLITASCMQHPDGRTVLFHLEREERLCHLRVEVAHGEAMPAIDAAFPAAFLVENEMSELQGLTVEGMSIDYGGRLYRDFDALEGAVHDRERDDDPASRGSGADAP
jgi:hypothetical protein